MRLRFDEVLGGPLSPLVVRVKVEPSAFWYAISEELDRDELARASNDIYRQLLPKSPC